MIKINEREKRLLQILIIVIGCLVVYFLIIMPFFEFRKSAEEQIKKNIQDLNKMDELNDEYREIRQKITKYQSALGNKNENTTTLVEQWAATADVTKNIAYTRRTQSSIQNKYIRTTIDVKLDSVPIQKFMKFLYEIENSNKLLKISYLRIYQALKGADTYDVILKIESFSTQ
jgi:type II secretory pathway component PulM